MPPPTLNYEEPAKAGPDAPTRPTTRRLKHHVCAYSPTFRLCSNERQPKNQHNLTYKPQIGTAAPPPQPGKTKTADPEGSAVSSCARGELNPHSITGTRT